MPWEIRIVSDTGDLPLGTEEAVVSWVAKSIQGWAFLVYKERTLTL
jgi:hypothetical protein